MIPRPGRVTVEQYEPEILLGRPEWHTQAACRGYMLAGKDYWFPTVHNRGAAAIIAQAKMICHTCPVKQQCLDDAMSHSSTMPGIWGGLTVKERRTLRWPIKRLPGINKHGSQGWDQNCRCHICDESHRRKLNRKRQTELRANRKQAS